MSTRGGQTQTKRRTSRSSLANLMAGLRVSYIGIGTFVAYKLMKQEIFNENEMRFIFATNTLNELLMYSKTEEIINEDPEPTIRDASSLKRSILTITCVYASTLILPYTKYEYALKYVVAGITFSKSMVALMWLLNGCKLRNTQDTICFSGFVYGIAFGALTRQLFTK